MANVRLNKFESFPLIHRGATNVLLGNASLHVLGVVIPGSISFNNLAVILSQGNTGASVTLSFGLYSLNGSTLSLANSASRSFNTNANGLSWITLATSATQDITPGNWYFALMSSVSGGAENMSILCNALGNIGPSGIVYGGVFVRGVATASTSVLPSSIATSALSKEQASAGADEETLQPYILISA